MAMIAVGKITFGQRRPPVMHNEMTGIHRCPCEELLDAKERIERLRQKVRFLQIKLYDAREGGK